jgi:hypothetical protein
MRTALAALALVVAAGGAAGSQAEREVAFDAASKQMAKPRKADS